MHARDINGKLSDQPDNGRRATFQALVGCQSRWLAVCGVISHNPPRDAMMRKRDLAGTRCAVAVLLANVLPSGQFNFRQTVSLACPRLQGMSVMAAINSSQTKRPVVDEIDDWDGDATCSTAWSTAGWPVIVAVSIWAAIGAPGCVDEPTAVTDPPQPVADLSVAPNAIPSAAVTEASTETLRIADWQTVQSEIRERPTRLVVVDIWTTTCLTCVEEFPKFVELAQEFPPSEVTFVTLCCDYDGLPEKPPEHYRPKVMDFLEKQQAVTVNYLLSTSFLDFLDIIGLSSTPAVLVYGADGRLLRRFDNDLATSAADEFHLSDVRTFVLDHLSR